MGLSKLIRFVLFTLFFLSCSKEYVASNGILKMKVDKETFISNSVYGQFYKDKNTKGVHFQNRYVFGTENPIDKGFNFRLELTAHSNDSSLQFSGDQLTYTLLTIFGEQNNSIYSFKDGYADIIKKEGDELEVRFSVKLNENKNDSPIVVEGTFDVKDIEQYDAEIVDFKF